MKFEELGEEEFRDFEQRSCYGNFFQTVERARLRRKMGWRVWLLGLKEGDEVRAGGLVMARHGEALVQLGPILDWEDLGVAKKWLVGVMNFVKQKGLVCLEVFPPVLLSRRDVQGEVLESFDRKKLFSLFKELGFGHMGLTVELENKANRWMVIKDLTTLKNMDEVRASYKKNVRNKLRKVSKDLVVEELTDKNQIEDLAKVVDESNAKNGVVSRQMDYYRWIWDEWGDQVRFVVAKRKEGGEVVAGRILFYHPNEVVSFISGTAQEWKKLNGMTFLQDWLMEDCLSRGIGRVNFYGIDGDFSGKNPLLEFKSGFGVEVEEYVGGFRWVAKPLKYRLTKMEAEMRGVARKVLKKG